MEVHVRYPVRNIAWIGAAAVLACCSPVFAQSPDTSVLEPLGQLPGDNRHPDFTSQNNLQFAATRGQWLVWDAGFTRQRNVYATYYLLQESRWLDPVPITSDAIPDANPAISQIANRVFWIAWERLRNDRWEIWGMPQTVLGDNITAARLGPRSFELSDNYPNPFNSG